MSSAQAEDLLRCGVCTDFFDRQYSVPLVLGCGHTLCKSCICSIQQKWGAISCPMDRKQEQRPLGQLQVNSTMLNLLDIIRENRGSLNLDVPDAMEIVPKENVELQDSQSGHIQDLSRVQFFVTVHPHPLVQDFRDNGWGCDGRSIALVGCKSGVSGFRQTQGFDRFRCGRCDFDLCLRCLSAYILAACLDEQPIMTSIHAHPLAIKLKNSLNWICQGTRSDQGCYSMDNTVFQERWKCNACKVSFCRSCVMQTFESCLSWVDLQKPVYTQQHPHPLIKINVTSDWACDGVVSSGCRGVSKNSMEIGDQTSWRCQQCDYDLCIKCVVASSILVSRNNQNYKYQITHMFWLILFYPIHSQTDSNGSIFDMFDVSLQDAWQEAQREQAFYQPRTNTESPLLDNARIEDVEQEQIAVTRPQRLQNQAVPIGDMPILNLQNRQARVYQFQGEPEEQLDNTQAQLNNQLLELQRENRDLNNQSVDLLENNAELYTELIDGVRRLNRERVDEIMSQQSFSTEISSLEDQNQVILQRVQGIIDEDEREEEDDDGKDLYQLDVNDAMIYIISMGFLFLVLNSIRSLVGYFINPIFDRAFYYLYVDIVLLVFIIGATVILDYSDVFDEDRIDLNYLTHALSIFTLSWLIFGIILIFTGQSQMLIWQDCEDKCIDLQNLYKEYSESYQNLSSNPQDVKQFNKIHFYAQYAAIRQSFITPIYIPPVTEAQMRNDFDFSQYLTRCLSDTICQVFLANWLGYLLVVIVIVLWRVIQLWSKDFDFILLWSIPATIIIINIMFSAKLRQVYFKLIPYLDNPNEFKFLSESTKRSLANYELTLPVPKYLQGSIPDLNNPDEQKQFLCFKLHFLKLTCSYILDRKLPNRHQLQFWFDSYGPKVSLCIIQASLILAAAWLAVVLLYAIDLSYDEVGWVAIFVIGGCILIQIIMNFIALPYMTMMYTMVTSIEFMKNRKMIQETVQEMQKERALRSVRFYRQFKMIYRELENLPQLEDLPEKIDQLISEVFYLVADRYDVGYYLHINQLDECLTLLGSKLDLDELRLFAKECNPDDDEMISLENFKKASYKYYESTSFDSFNVTKSVLDYYTREFRNIQNGEKINIEDIRSFLDEFSWHFNQQDMEEFMWEVRFLLDDQGETKTKDVASMLRDEIEFFPS